MEDNYKEKIFDNNCGNSQVGDKVKNAFDMANQSREFEINNFWSRGTYYWAYITGISASYIWVLNKALGEQKILSLKAICDISAFSKFILFIISTILFFFSLAYVYVNKASKFWQENWEIHLNQLEEENVGNLYRYIPKNQKGNWIPFKISSFGTSVSKITIWCSILISVFSFALCVFHLLIQNSNFCDFVSRIKTSLFFVCSLIILFVLFIYFIISIKSNNFNDKEKHVNYHEIKKENVIF